MLITDFIRLKAFHPRLGPSTRLKDSFTLETKNNHISELKEKNRANPDSRNSKKRMSIANRLTHN